MKREAAAVTLFAVASIAVVGVSIATKGQIRLPAFHLKWVGRFLIAMGMILAAVAAKFIGRAVNGSVLPVLDHVVTCGPYRIVRHPIYLGFLISLVGVALVAESYLGIVTAVFIFLPAAAYRAHLEERSLHSRFGKVWSDYAKKTRFIIPLVW